MPVTLEQSLWDTTTGRRSHYKRKQWLTQPKPYLASLPYTLEVYSSTKSGIDAPNASANYAPYSSAVEAQAKNKAITSLYDNLRVIDLAPSLATIGKTVDMVRDRAWRLANGAVLLKKGRVLDAMSMFGTGGWKVSRNKKAKYLKKANADSKLIRQGTKDFGSAWLEYSYGWKPLISDVYGALKEWEEPAARIGQRVTGKGHAFRDDTFVQRYKGSRHYTERTIQTHAFITAQAVAYFEAIPGLTSFNLANPATIVWEMIPFSFVVDWFFPVQTWLSAMDPKLDMSLKYKSITTKGYFHTGHTWACIAREPGGCDTFDVANYDDHGGAATGFRLKRTLDLSIQPVLYTQFLQGSSITRALNAISLLAQAFRSK